MDPVLVADVVLEAALVAQADSVHIEPAGTSYRVAILRQGETLTVLMLHADVATYVIARLGYVCGLAWGERRAQTGRTRVRALDVQRDIIVTIQPPPRARAEVTLLPCVEASEPAIGERIGHYRVLAPIGAGGMGNVYEVVHERLHRRHALKVLQGWVLERDRASVERFLQEAQAAARIRSPHIVEIFDFGHLADGRPYFVMELLEGESLAALIARGPLAPSHAVAIAYQLAQALAAAHARAVIHADVTPSNILVTNSHVTLIDFGLAHLLHDGRPGARSDEVNGTPAYLSPERMQGFAPDEASDQYACGIVLHEMLAGAPPFSGTHLQIGMAHLDVVPPPVTSPYGQLPRKLIAIVARCLAKDPRERFCDMQALCDELGSIEELAS